MFCCAQALDRRRYDSHALFCLFSPCFADGIRVCADDDAVSDDDDDLPDLEDEDGDDAGEMDEVD